MSDVVIQIAELGKQYRLGTVGTGTLSHDLNRWWHRVRGLPDPYVQVGLNDGGDTGEDPDYMWALTDINLEICAGEVVGVIGRNGAGKSTLLKILSRITAPTRGEVKLKGRIGSLLEVGTGFHLELTGRENVYLNGAILGMTRAEVAARLDEIIDFSGCERYIDTPVKRYSSGMLVRLAFAVAAHLDPEILVVDEVLAVGDAQFQAKCLGKMGEIATQGRTVLLVSHNMASIESLCSRAVSLDGGTVQRDGPVHDVVADYLSSFGKWGESGPGGPGRYARGSGEAGVIRSVAICDVDGNPVAEVQSGRPLSFLVELASPSGLHGVAVGLHIEDEQGRRVTSLHTAYHPAPPISLHGNATLRCRCEGLPLAPGRYHVTAAMGSASGTLDNLPRQLAFQVVESDILGTGKFPPAKDGLLIARGAWECVVEGSES